MVELQCFQIKPLHIHYLTVSHNPELGTGKRHFIFRMFLKMTLGYTERYMREWRTVGPFSFRLLISAESFTHQQILWNTSSGQGILSGVGIIALHGAWALLFPLAGSVILTLNHDPDWSLLYSSLVGAVTTGQLLHFASESFVFSLAIGHFLECTDPFQGYHMLFDAWGIDSG